MMKLELVSFKMCPFVQRSVATMNHKNVDYDITYIDLENPPAWFSEISPLGKVPLLKVDGDVLFESAVINEFVDEISEGSLLSENPLERAKQRAWIEYGSELNMLFYFLSGADDKAAFDEKADAIRVSMQRVEDLLGDKGYFSGNSLSLVDTSYAPFLMRIDLLSKIVDVLPEADFPKAYAWRKSLMSLKAIQKSVTPAFGKMFDMMLENRSAYLAGLL